MATTEGLMVEINGDASGLEEAVKEATSSVKQLGKMGKSMKGLLTAIAGVRTVYAGIRKAMTTYLAQNEELNNKLNACYYAIGSLLAPVVEYLVNLFVKLVVYANQFLIALGFAGMKLNDFNKAAKQTKNSLAGFDEINNMSDSSGSNSSNPFAAITVTDEQISKISQFAKVIKENLADIIKVVLTFVSAILLVKSGFEAIEALGISLAIYGVISLVQDFIKYMNDPSWKTFINVVQDIGIVIAGVSLAMGSWVGVVVGAVTVIATQVVKNWDMIKSKTASIWNSIKTTISNVWNSIWNTIKGIINKIIGGIEKGINAGINGINKLTSGIRKLGNSVLSFLGLNFQIGSLSNISLPRLATGTNYVPNNMVAQLHKGEAVVPKKFNENEFNNSELTNQLLNTLINKVDAINFNPYISVKDIGKASVKYINQQSRIVGGSLV